MAAYDIAKLVEGLKSKGLDVAEEAAKHAAVAVLEWVEKSAQESATPFDDVLLVVIPKAKELALQAIDKIDGEIG